jgi:hypothetical protein
MLKRIFFRSLLLAFFFTMAACASGYSEFYRPFDGAESILATRASAPPVTPLLERASELNDKLVMSYFRRGYMAIGYSFFNSKSGESESAALEQGQIVGADVVLVLDPQYTGSVSTSVPITTPTTTTSYSTGSATAYGTGGSATAYGNATTTTYGTSTTYIPITVDRSNYGAVYFVKRHYSLGILFRDLNDIERQELQSNRGAVVEVVIDDSPAFHADILIGDVVAMVDGQLATWSRSR